MSLILDALRKSEAQRRRGELPALSLELPPAATRPSPSRAWWIALPVGIALAALAIWLIGPSVTPVPEPEAQVAQPPQPIDARPTEAIAAPAPPPEAPQPPAGEPSTTNAPAGPTTVALSDLTPTERRALPPLKLSMHLWSEDPARRFVILDGHRLSEGDRAGNAVVERIDPTGVILAADGRRIRLPLP